LWYSVLMPFGEIPDSFDAIPEINVQAELLATQAFADLTQCENELQVADVLLKTRECALNEEVPYELIEAGLSEKVTGWAAQGAGSPLIDTLTWLLT